MVEEMMREYEVSYVIKANRTQTSFVTTTWAETSQLAVTNVKNWVRIHEDRNAFTCKARLKK